MATNSSSLQIVNLRWQVNAETLLSMSTWLDGERHHHAVALLRKRGSKWAVDSESAVEFVCDNKKAAVENADFRATDYGATLVAQVLGECPFRFFRDAAL